MLETLQLVAAKHGSLAEFIRESGLTEPHVTELRKRLIA